MGTKPDDTPRAEAAYEQILSLPIYPIMTNAAVDFVIEQVVKAVGN